MHSWCIQHINLTKMKRGNMYVIQALHVQAIARIELHYEQEVCLLMFFLVVLGHG